MGFLAPIASALSIFSAAKGLFGGKEKAPQQQPTPAAPTPAGAQTDAQEEIKKRRRASLLSGGETDITKGAGIVNTANIGKKSLVGQ